MDNIIDEHLLRWLFPASCSSFLFVYY